MARLRRLRWLAALFVVFSPAGMGQVLPVLRPCVVDAPWMVPAHAGHAAMSHMHHEATQTAQKPAPHNCCSCIGCFAAPSILLPPAPSIAAVEVDVPVHGAWPLIEAGQRLAPSVTLLPPSTAPPLA